MWTLKKYHPDGLVDAEHQKPSGTEALTHPTGCWELWQLRLPLGRAFLPGITLSQPRYHSHSPSVEAVHKLASLPRTGPLWRDGGATQLLMGQLGCCDIVVQPPLPSRSLASNLHLRQSVSQGIQVKTNETSNQLASNARAERSGNTDAGSAHGAQRGDVAKQEASDHWDSVWWLA